ncbi:hematopoietic progenitor cell antigen CD34 isoform X1 [Syngnathus acus]|uniref:hematopoietic progenitor cell antigen CD34 isoform X1 n=1 Tax=Syngnathus acus TaxID=161584 RepID=UPI001885BB68|nr:hematopoietic progenitor cell antigen CD34 isoform X1 [Syngnathus acus]
MAAASPQRAGPPSSMLALAFLLLMIAGVRAQDDIVAEAASTVAAEEYIRGDMIPMTTEAPESDNQAFEVVMETQHTDVQTTLAPFTKRTRPDSEGEDTPAAVEDADKSGQVSVDVYADEPQIQEKWTVEPAPPRGDGPDNIPDGDVMCVGKEVVQDKNAVNLKLIQSSICKNTKMKIQSVREQLCGEDCKLLIYQEDNTDQILVAGQYVEEDIKAWVNKFNNDNIKDKTGVKEAVPHWRKNSKLVLVSLLLSGLLLAALLVAGYYFKTHRKNSKGVRLAESYQVDEENQANTLVSVAPLPQEPVDKPAVANGESPPENGTSPAPTTNGHSASGPTAEADTEM